MGNSHIRIRLNTPPPPRAPWGAGGHISFSTAPTPITRIKRYVAVLIASPPPVTPHPPRKELSRDIFVLLLPVRGAAPRPKPVNGALICFQSGGKQKRGLAVLIAPRAPVPGSARFP